MAGIYISYISATHLESLIAISLTCGEVTSSFYFHHWIWMKPRILAFHNPLRVLTFLLGFIIVIYKCNPLRIINSYFSHMWWSHIIILFPPLDLNETSYPSLPQPTHSSYFFYLLLLLSYDGISNKTSKK